MGLFDAVRIPAQAGDWLMLESYNSDSPDYAWVTFLPIIAWRKETSDLYYPEFIDQREKQRITSQKAAGQPWFTYFIRGGLVMNWGGEPQGELSEWLMATANNYFIRGIAPSELNYAFLPAFEASEKRRRLEGQPVR